MALQVHNSHVNSVGRFGEHVKEHEVHSRRQFEEPHKSPKILPILALNDVFIGESLSARYFSCVIQMLHQYSCRTAPC